MTDKTAIDQIESDEEIISSAQTAKGSPLLTSDQLKRIAKSVLTAGMGIQSMEAFEYRSEDRQPLRTDLSILGLDTAENWEEHESAQIAFNLVMKKLDWAIQEGVEVRFIIWVVKPGE